ncbi:MAG: heme NO-binding domain-containing protein [Nocardioides sp.]
MTSPRHLGRAALAGLAERYPHFFAPHTAVRPFLLTLNDVIHPEVRKLHADAEPPEFWFDDGDGGPSGSTLLVHYRSTRRLCALADGMIQGAARHYGQEAVVEHRACVLEGDDHCVLHTTFAAA